MFILIAQLWVWNKITQRYLINCSVPQLLLRSSVVQINIRPVDRTSVPWRSDQHPTSRSYLSTLTFRSTSGQSIIPQYPDVQINIRPVDRTSVPWRSDQHPTSWSYLSTRRDGHELLCNAVKITFTNYIFNSIYNY